jgi:hypothetical protein
MSHLVIASVVTRNTPAMTRQAIPRKLLTGVVFKSELDGIGRALSAVKVELIVALFD